MPKYANNQEYRPREVSGTQAAISNFSSQLPALINNYKAQQDEEKYTAIVTDPNASPIQQALAWTKLKNPQAAAQVIQNQNIAQKGEIAKNVMADTNRRIAENRGENGNQPSINQLRNELPGAQPDTPPMMLPGKNAQLNQQQQPQQRNPIEVRRNEVDILNKAAEQLEDISPSKAKNLRHQATTLNKRIDTDVRSAAEVEKANIKTQQRAKEFNQTQNLKIHDESKSFDDSIQNEAKSAVRDLHSSDVARKAIMSKNINPKSFRGIMRSAFKGTKWEEYFNNPDIATLEAASLTGYEGMRQLFGGILSDADLKIVSRKVISPDKSPETNLAILDFRDFQNTMKVAEAEIGDEIKAENGGYRPIDYRSQVNKRMQDRFGEEFKQAAEKAIESDREVFNLSNKLHRERREQVLEEVGGNREEANRILAKEFK